MITTFKHNRIYIKQAVWFLILECLDVVTTRIGVALGATELNFIVKFISLDGFLIIKTIVTIAIAYVILTKGIKTKWIAIALYGILTAVVMLNIVRIITLLLGINQNIWI